MPDIAKTFMVEDAEITQLNFSGRAGRYNEEGQRSFLVLIDPDIAEAMRKDGWNVHYFNPRQEGDIPRPFINVAVRFDRYPPTIILLTSKARQKLNEDAVEILDWADIKTVDLIVRGHLWDEDSNRIKAYLKSMFVTINENPLELKYDIIANPPDNYGS